MSNLDNGGAILVTNRGLYSVQTWETTAQERVNKQLPDTHTIPFNTALGLTPAVRGPKLEKILNEFRHCELNHVIGTEAAVRKAKKKRLEAAASNEFKNPENLDLYSQPMVCWGILYSS